MSPRVCVRRLLAAAALLLVLALAAAAPASDDDAVRLNLVQSSAVTSKSQKDSTDADTTTAAAMETETSAPAPLPVNERFPHAVLYGRNCGGTIISPTWVITAAHCTIFTPGRTILAGTNNTMDGSGVVRRVKRLYVHPLFSVGPYWLDAKDFGIKQVAARWDFQLVELRDPLPLDGKTIAAVTLDDSTATTPGLEVGYAGYGAAHFGEYMRHTMHAMELTTIADDECQKKLLEYNQRDMLCTKGRPPRYDSACNGDSGSGLVANGKLLGVASWVENDAQECRNGNIVVFSRVAAVRDWIRQVTKI